MAYKQHGLACLGLLVTSVCVVADPLVNRNTTGVAQDQPYFTSDVGNTRLIFTEQNKDAAERAAGVEAVLQPLYQDSFGFTMDTRLSVGLMSSYNQIANGFSTQYPLNRQINYIGGALQPDYFTSSSWLYTLLTHETAHNYQLNAKDNEVSRGLFSVFRNGVIYTPFFPATVPNLFESGFMLEGNAVLNESRHGLGGRLYSGRLRALANAQAQAGYLTPERMYNRTLHFPYGETAYVMGGYFQYHMAEKYGLDNVNKYFKNRSQFWYWPFVVNSPLRSTVGTDFNQNLAQWAQDMKTRSDGMIMAQGDVVVRSQYFSPLNRQGDKVLFMTNPDARSKPVLNRYDAVSGELVQDQTSHIQGEVFVVGEEAYTAGSNHTSVWRVYQGLFDDVGQVLEGSEGKVMQGYMSDGREVYFDVASSFVNPQLHVGDTFYASVNSSVLVHGDDVYYCVQDGRRRTLYRNQEALYSFESYYGFPVDVDVEGRVYFVGNTEFGSSLFRVKGNAVERVLAADNIVDARLTQQGVLIAAVSADEYYYSLEQLAPRVQSPYVVNLFWDKSAGEWVDSENWTEQTVAAQQRVAQHASENAIASAEPKPLDLDTPYGFFNNIRYSQGNLLIATVTEDDNTPGGDEDKSHLTYNLSFLFEDPFTRSQYRLWAMRDDELSDLVGVGFSNNQYFLIGGINAYYVVNDGYENPFLPYNTRDSGIAAELRLPFVDQGYWHAEVAATYFQDYKLDEREPTSLQLRASRIEQHGISLLPNSEYSFVAYGVEDRGDNTAGGEFHFTTDFPSQFYLELGAKLSDSDASLVTDFNRRGVELSDDLDFIDNDPSGYYLPSLRGTTYAQKVRSGSVALTKVFDFSSYFFKFPVSLRREALVLGYRYFDIDGTANAGDLTLGQAVVGVDVDFLLMNILPITIALEYVYNDNEEITDRTAIQGRFNLTF